MIASQISSNSPQLPYELNDPENPPEEANDSIPESVFPPTRWTVIADARKNNISREKALANLCEAYWHPVYAYIRRSGKTSADAEDLTQSFFGKILSKDYIQKADESLGKFRTFLLTGLKAHLVDAHRYEHAVKRGGTFKLISFDAMTAEQEFRRGENQTLPPDIMFERQWATTLLNRVMKKLHSEYVDNGKEKTFVVLESYISWNTAEHPQQTAADELGIGVPAVRMQVYHLRRRFRELLHAAVADTVGSAAEVEKELEHLREVFN